MTFGNSFQKVGTWLASSAHLVVQWFSKIVSVLIPNNKLALTANDSTAKGGMALPAIRQESKKFLQYASESGVMIGEWFIPALKGLAIGVLCVIESLIEFCVVNTEKMLADVEALNCSFDPVFPLSSVLDSPATSEVAVTDEITDARIGALENSVSSLLVAKANSSIEVRLDALEDAVRSLSGQLAASAANREPTDHQPRTAIPSTWCYYHTRYGRDARKCGSVLCTFAPKTPNQNQTLKKSHV